MYVRIAFAVFSIATSAVFAGIVPAKGTSESVSQSVQVALLASESLETQPVTEVSGSISWRSGDVLLASQSSSQIGAELTGKSGDRHVVVQFSDALFETERVQLGNSGLTLLRSLGNHAYFAAIESDRLSVDSLTQFQKLQSVHAIQRAWKLDPQLITGQVPDHARLDQGLEKESDPEAAVYVLFHPDVPLLPDAFQAVLAHQGSVFSKLETVNGLVVHLPQSQVLSLADEDIVQWIEPSLPPLSVVNDNNRALTQAGIVQEAPYELDGSGVSVMVYDGGTVHNSHPDFGGRVTVGATQYDNPHAHATHVAGTVGGDGSESSGLYRGMAPGVDMVSYAYETTISGIMFHADPGDIEADYTEALSLYSVDIASNSIGSNVCANSYPCEITGDYGVASSLIDGLVLGTAGEPIRIVWANGNERVDDDGDCPGCHCTRCIDEGVHSPEGYHSTAPPACQQECDFRRRGQCE